MSMKRITIAGTGPANQALGLSSLLLDLLRLNGPWARFG